MSTNDRDLTFYNKTERPWLNRLDRASIVGHTTSNSTKLWVRLKKKGTYFLVLSEFSLKNILSSAPIHENNEFYAFDYNGNQVKLLGIQMIVVDGGTDFTATVDTALSNDLPNLKPDTSYYYAVYSESDTRWELGVEKSHTFKTLPEDGKGPWDITFGLYSCHMPFDPNSDSKADASMWSLMENELKHSNARFVIGGGDQVYCDGTDYVSIWAWLKKVKKYNPSVDDMRSWYRDIYRGYWGFNNLQAVYRQFPNYMIWDDHEIMDGWGSYTKKELSNQLDTFFEWEDVGKNVKYANRMFKAATYTYNEYQHSHNPATPKGQYDYSFSNCGADYYVLDMRGVRDYERDKNSILGTKQHKRFKQWTSQLDKEKEGPIFITSTVPMVHLKDFVSDILEWASIFGARDDVRDHWAHEKHSAEFIKILDTIFSCSQRTKRPIVILSGDVHIGGIFELFSLKNKYKNARVYQVTSSAITYAALGPLKLSLLGKGVAHSGEIGIRKENKKSGSGFAFRNHLIFPQYNFALLRYTTDGVKTTSIEVELVGKSDDSRVKESKRLNLLSLPK